MQEVPKPVLTAIGDRVNGTILAMDTVRGGLNSEIALRVRTSAETIFVKGLRTEHRRVWTQDREAEIAPFVHTVAPRVLWHSVEQEWNLVAFEHIEGRHVDYSPASRDLPLVVDTLNTLARIPCPDLPLRVAEQRWAAYVDDESILDEFRGPALLHTDFNDQNILITDDRALLVDWAWATRGAAWIDPALWVIWLISAGGHEPTQAEAWAAQTGAWHTAPPEALNAFAEANAKLWHEIGGGDPDPWTARMITAADSWRAYRDGQ